MMKKQVAGIVLAVSVVGGVGAGVAANALASDTPTADNAGRTPAPAGSSAPAPEQTPEKSPEPADDRLTVTLGAVGPVEAGMSKADALATGYFDADVKDPADGCPERPLSWKGEFVNTFDVQTLGNGEIVSIGIFGNGVLTDQGVGVGSTSAEVTAAYPDEPLVEAGYGQAGIRVFDKQDGGWLGFLFDTTPAAITGGDPVTFMEVTRSGEPSLMRDGC